MLLPLKMPYRVAIFVKRDLGILRLWIVCSLLRGWLACRRSAQRLNISLVKDLRSELSGVSELPLRVDLIASGPSKPMADQAHGVWAFVHPNPRRIRLVVFGTFPPNPRWIRLMVFGAVPLGSIASRASLLGLCFPPGIVSSRVLT